MAKAVTNALELPGISLEFVKKNWQMFVVVNILSVLAGIAALFDDGSNKESYQAFSGANSGPFSGNELAGILGVGIVLVIVLAAVAIFLNAMLTVLQLRAVEGKKPTFRQLVEAGKKFWLPLLLLEVLSGLMIIAGLILLIIPGIIILGRIIYAPYIMIDRGLGIKDSLKASNELSKTNQSVTWSVIGIFLLINIAGSILSSIPRVGTLLATALTVAYSLVIVVRYVELRSKSARKSVLAKAA